MTARCEECGSWDRECGSDKPVDGCRCVRCASATIDRLEKERDEALNQIQRAQFVADEFCQDDVMPEVIIDRMWERLTYWHNKSDALLAALRELLTCPVESAPGERLRILNISAAVWRRARAAIEKAEDK